MRAHDYRLSHTARFKRSRRPAGVAQPSIHLTDDGWVVRCMCGWSSTPFVDRSHAAQSRGRHKQLCPLEVAP